MALRTGLALCAGIGGLELGVRLALGPRYHCVGYVERDAYAAAALVARMEDQTLDRAPVWDDLASFPSALYRGAVDLVTAGFPCQPFSVAGSRRGTEDERWLWPDIARIVRVVGPELVFLENVPGLAAHGLGHVLGELAACGYDAEWDVFSAADVGAPQLRRRLFLLAWRVPDARDAIAGDVGEAMADADGTGLEGWRPERECGDERAARPGRAEVGDADRRRREVERLPQHTDERSTRGDLALGPGDDERFFWPPGPSDTEGWSRYPGPQPVVRRGTDGTASRVDRLRCLGNAVVPLVAARALRSLGERALR